MQIVYFHQSNAGRVVHTTHNRGVVARWQLRDDCRVIWVAWSVAAIYDVLHLVSGDNPADDRRHPIVIRGNQSSRAIMQFQGRISQWIGHRVLSEIRTNSTNNNSLWSRSLNDEAANQHVVVCLNKRARTDIA